MLQALNAIPRDVLVSAVMDAYLDGLPEEFGPEWTYVTTVMGEHSDTLPTNRGRARLIIRHKRTGRHFALPYYEILDEPDMLEDRFHDETPQFTEVQPFERVTTFTDYRPVSNEPAPITTPIPTHTHPHID